MKSLGDMIGVSGTAISRYENGEDKPQADKVRQLAEKLNFPIEFFSRKAWTESLEPVFWRSRAAETKHAREITEQRMKWLCEIFAFLSEEVNFPAQKLPELPISKDFRLLTSEDIENAAMTARRSWGLRELPIPDVILALENVGIPVATLEISSDKQDGFCFRSKSLQRTFVGINTYNVSGCRARFDAAHELGHILLHAHVSPEQVRDRPSQKILEQQAHRFAGALLFPRVSFLAEVDSISLDYFSSLKKRWGMSIAAMINRAYDLGLIDPDHRRVMFQNMTRRRWRGGPLREPFDDLSVMPLEQPRMLRRAVNAVLDNGIFARATLRAAIPVPQHELEQLIGAEKDFLSEGEVVSLRPQLRRERPEAVDLESGEIVEFIRRTR